VAFVVVEEKGQQVVRTELKGPTMTIGRDDTSDIKLENRALSRRHAQLEVRGASIWIRDLGSQNGTFINGEKLEGTKPIQAGDVISLGGKFTLRLDGVEEAKTTTPVLTLTGPEGTHRFAMVGEEIVLGRSPDCDISIGRKSISRRHLRVVIQDGKFQAEDLGSQNGTRVNGEKIRGLTPVTPDDEIRISEYLIRVSYLDQSEAGGDPDASDAKPSRTMLFDKSKLAAAADLGGDFQVQVTHENRLSFTVDPNAAAPPDSQRKDGGDWADGDDLGDTAAAQSQMKPAIKPPMAATKGTAPATPKAATRPPTTQSPAQAPAKATTRQQPAQTDAALEVSHQDGATRTVKLGREPVCVAEDGSEDQPQGGSHYAAVGYLMFAPSAGGWLVTAIGDRRFAVVGGNPVPFHVLKDGDTVELGGLTVMYRV